MSSDDPVLTESPQEKASEGSMPSRALSHRLVQNLGQARSAVDMMPFASWAFMLCRALLNYTGILAARC